METNDIAPVKGRARLMLADDLIQQLSIKVEKPKAGAITWGVMEVKELFDLFTSALLLPAHFTVLAVLFDIALYEWVLVIESPAIPATEPHLLLPYLNFRYERTADGKIQLLDYQSWR